MCEGTGRCGAGAVYTRASIGALFGDCAVCGAHDTSLVGGGGAPAGRQARGLSPGPTPHQLPALHRVPRAATLGAVPARLATPRGIRSRKTGWPATCGGRCGGGPVRIKVKEVSSFCKYSDLRPQAIFRKSRAKGLSPPSPRPGEGAAPSPPAHSMRRATCAARWPNPRGPHGILKECVANVRRTRTSPPVPPPPPTCLARLPAWPASCRTARGPWRAG